MTELNWRKSTYTDKYNCVEVAMTAARTAVRDSKNRDGETLNFTAQHWYTFLSAVKADQYRR
ncbi:DUF397 domain-containing protein [Saccharopolyspora phatthalungensis]|uniref:DUF397 domain-containing protein n=1 Tax=Saccharopolyspora phatthalungensis TaxID=664693 RepID=A0A840Q5Z9_9PSEU|nr:DUF397 domain-containing protein [Saccharopolyspora phatthalungensis]MBB5155121.1 hypothetical protein [Saccharopolyspora phatthalungensis]